MSLVKPIPQQAIDSDVLVRDLSQQIEGDVRFDDVSRMLYSTDASNYQIEPIGVVCPKHADDIVAVHTLASKHAIPLLPRGGGTSLAGQTVGHALVMDLSRYLNNVLNIDPEARTATVQPGVILTHLNAQLSPLGLTFGPDPASGDRATIGGSLGNNATGTHSILYGMFGDHVRSVDVVLSDGTRLVLGKDASAHPQRTHLEDQIRRILRENAVEIAARYPKTWRNVAGYPLNTLDPNNLNLARLFAGAEGTLGTVVSVTLDLVPRPSHTCMVLLHFDDMRAALETVPAILETEPAAVELIDRMLLDMTRTHPEYAKLLTFVEGDPAAILVVEFYGDNDAELTSKTDRLRARLAQTAYKGSIMLAVTPQQIANVTKVRKAGVGLLMSLRGDLKPVPFIEDAAVPVEHLPDYITGIQEMVAAHDTQAAIYAHASAGCLHVRPLVNLKTADGLRHYRAIAEAAADLAIAFGGTTTGEHGEGLSRGEFSQRLYGPQITEAFRQVKRTFDPHGLMNPGKVVGVGAMDDPRVLRYGPDYTVRNAPVRLRLNWSKDGGYLAAVEMCNGAGVCRKEGTGVMCPSYMATRDEAASTRGRANALRLAMMGALGSPDLANERAHEVLDLCLSCKACKTECPSRVDVARLKAEFTASYFDTHRVPLRTWMFGHIHRLNRLGSLLPRLSNLALQSPIAHWVFTHVGIAPQRQMPLFARERFSVWYNKHHAESNHERSAAQAPILISDTYTEYNYPHLGRAALRVAEAAGFAVQVWGPRQLDCCGRPLISKGLLDDARILAIRNVRRMAALAKNGQRFMLIEPSCAAAFRDEYPDLVSADMRADALRVAEAVITVEEWLAEIAGTDAAQRLTFDDAPRQVLLHGHCYQRALWGTSATHRALQLIPHCNITELDDGCCGLAGSFGYEAEHYDLSITIGEQRLFPAVRRAQDAVVLASGVSCREQIAHGTNHHALHPIEFFAQCLVPAAHERSDSHE